MRQVTSQALDNINEVVGLGRGGAQLTQFEDGILQQTLVANDFIRRSKALGGSEGLFGLEMANVHAGATTISLNVDPYALTLGTEIPPYPTPVPRGFDFWLLDATVLTTGAGIITDADVHMTWPATKTAFLVAGSTFHAMAAWDGDAVVGTIARWMTANGEINTIRQRLGVRVPRGATIGFGSAASAAGTATFQITCALLPAGLGQDGII